MCLSPIDIINPSKYISLQYRSRYLLQVPCGHCAECAASLSQQWFYRTWYEFKEIFHNGGFVYFDTLTYNNKNLPCITNFAPDAPSFPCFDSSHIRNFVEALRLHLKRYYNVEFRHFLSSEYGTRQDRQHRPHYHILFFVNGEIEPLLFSRLVSKYWFYGRTDGVPYHSDYYVLTKNYIKSATLEQQLRVCNYVTKYVQKSCLFDSEIEKRINIAFRAAADKIMPGEPELWMSSVNGRRYKMKLKRHINQFHRQSQHFGECALSELDLNQLFRDGCLYMPSFKSVKVPISLPTYYKRKLFYNLLEVDGTKVWVLNDLGKQYKQHRLSFLKRDLSDRFWCACRDFNITGIDPDKLSNYVLDYRGRIKAVNDDDFVERCKTATLFNYSTLSDLEHLSGRGVYPAFQGNNSIGYNKYSSSYWKFSHFISKYVYLDEDLEHQLNIIYSKLKGKSDKKQNAYVLKQRLEQLFKPYKQNSSFI